jgi:hypothetical protein
MFLRTLLEVRVLKLLAWGQRRRLVAWEAMRMLHQACSVRFKNVHIDRSYECTLNTVNVFERGMTLRGPSDVSLAVATLPTAAVDGVRRLTCK